MLSTATRRGLYDAAREAAGGSLARRWGAAVRVGRSHGRASWRPAPRRELAGGLDALDDLLSANRYGSEAKAQASLSQAPGPPRPPSKSFSLWAACLRPGLQLRGRGHGAARLQRQAARRGGRSDALRLSALRRAADPQVIGQNRYARPPEAGAALDVGLVELVDPHPPPYGGVTWRVRLVRGEGRGVSA